MYYELTDLEKKEFFQDFIESIELHPERLEDGRIVKQINFMFPVFYKGVESMAIRLPNEKTVETVVLLQKSNRKCASNEPKSSHRIKQREFEKIS